MEGSKTHIWGNTHHDANEQKYISLIFMLYLVFLSSISNDNRGKGCNRRSGREKKICGDKMTWHQPKTLNPFFKQANDAPLLVIYRKIEDTHAQEMASPSTSSPSTMTIRRNASAILPYCPWDHWQPSSLPFFYCFLCIHTYYM